MLDSFNLLEDLWPKVCCARHSTILIIRNTVDAFPLGIIFSYYIIHLFTNLGNKSLAICSLILSILVLLPHIKGTRVSALNWRRKLKLKLEMQLHIQTKQIVLSGCHKHPPKKRHATPCCIVMNFLCGKCCYRKLWLLSSSSSVEGGWLCLLAEVLCKVWQNGLFRSGRRRGYNKCGWMIHILAYIVSAICFVVNKAIHTWWERRSCITIYNLPLRNSCLCYILWLSAFTYISVANYYCHAPPQLLICRILEFIWISNLPF